MDALDAMISFHEKAKFDNFNENLRMTEGVVVRHLLLPGFLDNSKEALKLLFNEFENNVKYSLMSQYTPVISKDNPIAKKYPSLTGKTSTEEYEELLNFADSLGIEDYYWQKGDASLESFIPDWDL